MEKEAACVRSYRDLIVWQKSVDLVVCVYNNTRAFPREEIYGLTSQLRRAAVSVPSNIAEGHSRNSTGEFKQFLGHSKGSLSEMETQIVIAEKLSYISTEVTKTLLAKTSEISRMLNGLSAKLEHGTDKHAPTRPLPLAPNPSRRQS
jgi:four helix bundle protein